MRYMWIIPSMILTLFVAPGQGQAAGGETVLIVIRGDRVLPKPIAITDPAITSRFKVGMGPGTFVLSRDGSRTPTKTTPSLIVDWERRVADLPKGLQVYEVSFVTPRRDPNTYTVLYAIDPLNQLGYVYIPGEHDPQYANNISMIHRGVEGNWFRAWSAWEEIANPLIAQALARR